MNNRLETLRLAVGLAHSVPGGEVHLDCRGCGEVVAGSRPGVDFGICDFRRVVVDSAGPRGEEAVAMIEGVRLGGTLVERGAGIYANRTSTREERWFVTRLGPRSVSAVLEDLESDLVPDDAVDALLKPDPCLAVTAVRLTTEVPCVELRLDDAAAAAYGACLTAELVLEGHDGVPLR